MGIARLIWMAVRSCGGDSSVTPQGRVGQIHIPGGGYLTVSELQRISSGVGEPRLGGRDGLRDYDEWAELGLPPAVDKEEL